ncbi:FUSC family protein [Variovorax sp. J22P168]|uniref:FUSC family protein n=1 Tax=Variovorax jilinensis TaxID=3053513 RepID=UPI002577C3F1|nr:FUSC family protein [Variovorax sp. J22P168]MDM0014461.1 FUSC family protein [Variovorax sp. J22P168]
MAASMARPPRAGCRSAACFGAGGCERGLVRVENGDMDLHWLARFDADLSRRYKGLRLVTAYGLAALLGWLLGGASMPDSSAMLAFLAGNFALWASVSEGRESRPRAARDLVVLCAAAAIGGASFIVAAPLLATLGRWGPELVLVTGAFGAGCLKRFGMLGGGVGSQVYIGQLLAFSTGQSMADLPAMALAGLAAAAAAVLARSLVAPARPPPVPVVVPAARCSLGGLPGELAMGLQAATGALAVIALDALFGLEQPAWAITACVYVIAGTASGTAARVRQRIAGTWVGVLLGLACLPLAEHVAPLAWALAACAMVLYAVTLVERYDIACGAFAFVLVLTLAASGEHSVALLASRAWETMLGGLLGLLSARLVLPLRAAA